MATIDSRIPQLQAEERGAPSLTAFWQRAGALHWSVALAAVLYFCGYLLAALLRMRYPFEIGFMDGNFLLQLERVLHGQPLYTAPTLSYTPMVYAPLFFHVSALAAKLVGSGMTPMRLVSFLASLGSFAVLYRFALRETASRYCALVSVGLYAATYRETSYAFDLATTDSLYIFLLVSGAYLLRWRREAAWLALAGALLGLSFLTKQTALIIALPLAAFAAIEGRRALLAFAGSAAAVGGGGVALLHWTSGGWSTVYMFSAISTVFTAWRMFGLFWARDVFLVLPIAALHCALYFLNPSGREDPRARWFYACFGAGTFAAGWLYMLNWGAGTGGRIPPYFFLCLLTGVGLGRVMKLLAANPATRLPWENVMYAALIIQFCALLYNPLQVVPRRADSAAGQQVVESIAKFSGPVFVPNHPYLPVMAGKPAFADMMNLRFVLKAKDQRAVEPLRAQLHRAFQQKQFSAVLVDADWTHELLDDEFRADLLENYVQQGEIPYADNTLFRITASVMMVRPQFIYVPKPEPRE